MGAAHHVEICREQISKGDPAERYCGSLKLYLPDGSPLPHAQSPIVDVLRTGQPVRNVEVLIERPDGSRLPVIVNYAALKSAEQALKQADRRKNEFLATLAHELRNPLAPIRNAVQLMQLHGQDAEQTQWPLDARNV